MPAGLSTYEVRALEHADVYKRYKLIADSDAVFGEVEAHVRSNGLDPGRVREILHKAFAPPCETEASNPS